MRVNATIYAVSTAIGLYWVLTDFYDRYTKQKLRRSRR